MITAEWVGDFDILRLELPTRDPDASADATDRIELSRDQVLELLAQLSSAIAEASADRRPRRR